MTDNSNLDALIERVIAKAREEAEAMTERAEKAAAREIRQAEEQAAKRLAAAEAAVRDAAEQRKHSVLAEVQQEERRTLMNMREDAVETVFTAALEELGMIDDEKARCELLVALVGEGVRALGVDAVRVRLNASELALARGNEFPKEIDGVSVTFDDETIENRGGPVVSDMDGRVVFENTFEARLGRMRGELRGQVARILGLV
jgi:vacuolar-type H+-ATPase subunit E/Vma4